MKKIVWLFAILLVTVQLNAQFTKATLQATGLTCAMCSNAINKALQTKPFIQSVRADIKNSAFNIVFKENVAVDIDEIRKAVEGAGFGIGSLKLTGVFKDVKIGEDMHVEVENTHFHFLNVTAPVLDGEQTITVVDKNFLTFKQFKKISHTANMECIQTGKAASCCKGVAAGTRIYHVTI